MQTATISFDPFNSLSDKDCHERIRAARAKLGKQAVILCHHYQRADVYAHADITGDSLKLSRLAAERVKERRKELDISQAALAEQVGVHQTMISAIERGDKAPSVAVLDRIQRVLGVELLPVPTTGTVA